MESQCSQIRTMFTNMTSVNEIAEVSRKENFHRSTQVKVEAVAARMNHKILCSKAAQAKAEQDILDIVQSWENCFLDFSFFIFGVNFCLYVCDLFSIFYIKC